MNKDKISKKKFFKSFIVLLRVRLTCKIKSDLIGQVVGASKMAAQKANN